MERPTLLLCAALLLQLHGVLSAGWNWQTAGRGNLFLNFLLSNKAPVGHSPGYYTVGKFLNSSMNRHANPCDDFYEYTCGNYGINNDYSFGKTFVGTFRKAQQDIFKKMVDLYKDPRHSGSSAIEKVKIAFRKCADGTENRVGIMLASIREEGGWPLLNKCPLIEYNLTSLIMLTKNKALLSFRVVPDEEHRSHILEIRPSKLDIPGARNYKEPEKSYKQIRAHKDYIYEKVNMLRNEFLTNRGVSCASGPVSRADIDEMFALETELFKARTSPLVKKEISLMNLQYPDINFLEIIAHYGGPKAVALFKMKPYVNIATKYIDTVIRLWRTKKQAMVNYIFWRYMRSQYLDKFQLRGQYAVVPEMIAVMNRNKMVNFPVEEGCSTVLSWFTDMPIHATSALYARKYVSKRVIDEVTKMAEAVKAAMMDMLHRTWMKGGIQLQSYGKLSYMKFNIGYPEWIMDNSALDEYYKDLKIENYFGYSYIVDHILRFQLRKEFDLLGARVDRERFIYPAQFANAHLSNEKNAIEFPAGLLHDPVFGVDYPRAVNFGTIGATLAHEMTHAFDMSALCHKTPHIYAAHCETSRNCIQMKKIQENIEKMRPKQNVIRDKRIRTQLPPDQIECKEYDEIGVKVNWWDNASLAEYNNRAKCFVDQFNGYRIEDTDLYVDGEKTLSENIADSNIDVAFKAYWKFLASLGQDEEPRVPGVEHLTNDQLFFVAASSFFCSKNTREDKIERHSWDSHAPDRHRVNGMMQNSREFAKVFNCPAGSKMVRQNPCHMFTDPQDYESIYESPWTTRTPPHWATGRPSTTPTTTRRHDELRMFNGLWSTQSVSCLYPFVSILLSSLPPSHWPDVLSPDTVVLPPVIQMIRDRFRFISPDRQTV
uniref:Peptidase_M13 domain-containing protein n=1 Tax=Steinernema glaseri TaxID=37863 RepID=A0A1I7Z1Z2_9BILA